jgi:ABC-type transport system involved in cytochrome c biogenesis permease subunit
MTPSPGQLALLILAILLFAAGGALSFVRLRHDVRLWRVLAKSCLYWGLLVALGVLVWHSADRQSWLPLEDNFDALVWVGILITGFVLYVQWAKSIAGLDAFLVPVTIILLIAAAVFGRTKPHPYLPVTWSWVHRVTAYGGAVAFAAAGAAGAMFLITNARLRRHKLVGPGGSNFGSLEGLERFTRTAVTLGFALLTIGLITGFAQARSGETRLGAHWFFQPKVLLATCVWVVYALVLHAPINPSFRGRRTAVLSIFGLVLMIGTLIAVQFMPSGGGR